MSNDLVVSHFSSGNQKYVCQGTTTFKSSLGITPKCLLGAENMPCKN